MQYLKFVFLALGLIVIAITRMKYTQRANALNNPEIPYLQEEKIILYSGYGLLAVALILIIIFG